MQEKIEKELEELQAASISLKNNVDLTKLELETTFKKGIVNLKEEMTQFTKNATKTI
jgi:hypothetical protein